MLDVFKAGWEFGPAYLDESYVPGRRGTFWQGGLCSTLRLRGTPSGDGLANLLASRFGHASTNGRKGDFSAVHLTWTAPKSVSVAALLGGETRLLDAHEKAVQIALRFALQHTYCRITNGRKTSSVPVRDVAMMLCHRTHSRADDPNLHTLVTVFNAVDVGDGVLRALDPRILVSNYRSLGAVYRAELRRLVSDLGFLTIDSGEGLWDLEGISSAICNLFSRRRDQIVEAVYRHTGKQPRDLPKQAERAFSRLTGRRKVAPLAFETMREHWMARVSDAGLSLDNWLPLAGAQATEGKLSVGSRKERIEQCAQALIGAHQTLRQPGYFGVLLVDVIGHAMKGAPGLSLEDMERGIRALLELGTLIDGDHPKVLYLRQEPSLATAQVRAAASTDADDGPLSAFIKVPMTPAERARAERFLLNRGHASFGAWLRTAFHEVPPVRLATQGKGRIDGNRSTALKARVSKALQERLINWGGLNLAASLRAEMLGVRQRDSQSGTQESRVLHQELVGPQQPASRWVKVALDREELRMAKQVIESSGSQDFRDFLERKFCGALPAQSSEASMEVCRRSAAGVRTHSLKARVTPSFQASLEEWAGGSLAPALRALVLSQPA